MKRRIHANKNNKRKKKVSKTQPSSPTKTRAHDPYSIYCGGVEKEGRKIRIVVKMILIRKRQFRNPRTGYKRTGNSNR